LLVVELGADVELEGVVAGRGQRVLRAFRVRARHGPEARIGEARAVLRRTGGEGLAVAGERVVGHDEAGERGEVRGAGEDVVNRQRLEGARRDIRRQVLEELHVGD
jgi:hypothetical protein